MPYILKANPDATIIISDLSPTVVSEWKALLDKTIDSPNLYYAYLIFAICRLKTTVLISFQMAAA